MMKRSAIVFVILFLSMTRYGDAIPKDFDPRTVPVITYGNYPPSLLKTGSGVIHGLLKAVTKTFGEVTYPNEDVLLMPNSIFSEWYIEDVAFMIENPYAKDALPNFPTDLVKYTRKTKSDQDGFFRFTGIPDGEYFVWTYVEHEVDSHPTRERDQLAMGADGSMISVPTFRKGLRIQSDDVVIASQASVDSADGYGKDKVVSFQVVGEFTCCSAQI